MNAPPDRQRKRALARFFARPAAERAALAAQLRRTIGPKVARAKPSLPTTRDGKTRVHWYWSGLPRPIPLTLRAWRRAAEVTGNPTPAPLEYARLQAARRAVAKQERRKAARQVATGKLPAKTKRAPRPVTGKQPGSRAFKRLQELTAMMEICNG